VGVKAKELLHMAFTDDPNGFRRGQPGGPHDPADRRGGDPRQPARQESRNGARQPLPRQDDPFPSFGNGADFQERPAGQGRQQQPSFSNYRPEAYANNEKRGGRPAERQDWPQSEPQFRVEPPLPPSAADRGRPLHDPYHNGASDPYDTGRRDFDANWQSDGYQEQPANQFAASSYYQHEDPTAPDAQSVHDRFFAADPEPERAPPMPQPVPTAPRYRANEFSADEYQQEEHHGAGTGGNDYRWDGFDQQPAPESVRPFPNAKIGPDEDLDADYFADEDEFDGDDDYAEPKKGGSKKLMAAVLVGAVVTGGGLAYLYKSQVGGSETGEPPIMTADTRPIKEKPSDPGGREFPGGSKLIYDRLNDGGGDEPTRVAARDEQTPANDVPGVVTTSASGTLEERIQNALRDAKKPDDQAPASANAASTLDTPRPVKTEIFRPDGSVDSSRVQRRQAPADGDTAPVAASAPKGVVAREAPAAPAQAAPARTQQLAAATPAQAPTPAPAAAATTTGEAGMFVQIAARNDQAAAMAAFADLQQKYSNVLGNHSPSVRKVDLGEKGVWYRLLVGPMANKAEADKLCEDLKTAGMKGCFSRKE
jgi:cell division septation protein DedD